MSLILVNANISSAAAAVRIVAAAWRIALSVVDSLRSTLYVKIADYKLH